MVSKQHTPYITEGISDTDNFIRNRLTVLTVVPTSVDPDSDGADELQAATLLLLLVEILLLLIILVILLQKNLGIVNVPIGHVTGTRAVSGSFTCYLTEETGAVNASSDFYRDLRSITNVVTNSFALTFKIGGASGNPRLEVAMPTCHIEVPTHSIEDVISLESNFMALPSTIDGTNEMSLPTLQLNV